MRLKKILGIKQNSKQLGKKKIILKFKTNFFLIIDW